MTTQAWEPAQLPRLRRWPQDLAAFAVVVVSCVLLGAPTGLLWSMVSPRITVRLTQAGPQPQHLEGKAFIGADGSYLVVTALVGVVCGLLAWRFARRHGPWTVVGLVVGGILAARVAAVVGVRPGRAEVMAMLHDANARGSVHLFLKLRSHGVVVGWAVGALVAFLSLGFHRPHELD